MGAAQAAIDALTAGPSRVVRHLGADDRTSTRVRIVDGALRCLARQGVAKSTVDDIARQAGLSRATVYRTFPRGKDDILAAVVETETARLFSSLAVVMGEAADLEDVLVAGMVESARWLSAHDALAYLLAHEPGVVLPHLTFAELDRVLLVAGDLAAPFFARWLEPEQASRAAEWAVRIVLAYTSDRNPGADLTDPDETRALVRAFVLPGILALRLEAAGSTRSAQFHLPTNHQGGSAMTTLDNEQGQFGSNLELIGRESIHDLEAVLSFVGHYDVEGFHRVPDNCPAEFTWDYQKGAKPQLDKLYEKAKKAQWNAQTDLDWSIEVDQEKVVMANAEANAAQMQWDDAALAGTVLEKWDEKKFLEFGIQNQNWLLSQFMHGEQGALLCTAKIVETVPWIDAKYYAATQVMDEARHVEVFSKYLDEKLSGHYPMNAHLGLLLDDIVSDSRWDMTYLGMQIMVEGLALAAFGFIHMMTTEPLLKKLLRYVMADEARHVAFGVLSLQEYYKELSAAELRERQEFAFEAAIRMKDRMAMQEVWERMEVPTADVIKIMQAAPERDDFQILLFSKIVPNLRKLGLLDAADGWLRQKFTDLGAIAFEHLTDSTEDEDAFADGSPAERQVA